MINWRNGKGGFNGGAKILIKGFFQFVHSITSAAIPVTPSLIVTTNIQIAYSTNIDLPVLTTDKKVSYTSNLGG